MLEGRGWILRKGIDGPWAGWMGLRTLARVRPPWEGPWGAVRLLVELDRAFETGLALVLDDPEGWAELEKNPGLLELLGACCRRGLHGTSSVLPLPGSPANLWVHGTEVPREALGRAWRQGWIGWVPWGSTPWALPGLGRAEESPEGCVPGALWGELSLPVGALAHVDGRELVRPLAEAQARLERDFSDRWASGGWPGAFPFHRRRCGWRVSLVGGREYRAAGGGWEEAVEALLSLRNLLEAELRVPVHVGACGDLGVASRLGHQALREGLPWRGGLPLPPSSPTFSPGLGADPREPSPLETRAWVPEVLGHLLSDPPVADLRVAVVPSEAACRAFVGGLTQPLPALRWWPPDLPPPGPFLADRPWAPVTAFPPPMEPGQALQPSLFDDGEAPRV